MSSLTSSLNASRTSFRKSMGEAVRIRTTGRSWVAFFGFCGRARPGETFPSARGNWKTVYDRFRRWAEDGTLEATLRHLQGELDADGNGAIGWAAPRGDGLYRSNERGRGSSASRAAAQASGGGCWRPSLRCDLDPPVALEPRHRVGHSIPLPKGARSAADLRRAKVQASQYDRALRRSAERAPSTGGPIREKSKSLQSHVALGVCS